MKKKELLEKRASLVKTETELLDRLNSEARLPTAEENTSLETLKADIEATEGQINAIEKIEQRTRENAERAAKLSSGRREPGQARENILDKPWTSLGEQLAAVAQASRPGSRPDPRLLETLAPSGASEQVPANGGFLVQTDFQTELLKKAHDASQIASRCRTIPLSKNSNRVKFNCVDETSRATGSRWGGVRVYRANEAATVTAAKPKFDFIEIALEKLMGLFYATDELMEDADALEAVATQGFVEEFAFKLDDEIIRGSGAGECLGILNAPALVSVAKEAGQAAATVLWTNIRKMRQRMFPRSRANAVWLTNSDVEPALETMAFDDAATSKVPVYLPANGITGSPFATLYGRPVIPVEQCETLGTKGDILFCDFSQYLLASKGGLKAAQSLHVLFLSDEATFRWTWRVNGQPAWKSALTPYKGTNTQSPFISLDTRA